MSEWKNWTDIDWVERLEPDDAIGNGSNGVSPTSTEADISEGEENGHQSVKGHRE